MARRLHRSNRQNSKRSTGPKSPSGKAVTARNAIKHGLSGKPELSEDEKNRLDHIRGAISELCDEPGVFGHDIEECAISQVLLERAIKLRHQAHTVTASTIKDLEKLVRFENSLIKQRNKLMKLLDVDEYADVDLSIWSQSI